MPRKDVSAVLTSGAVLSELTKWLEDLYQQADVSFGETAKRVVFSPEQRDNAMVLYGRREAYREMLVELSHSAKATSRGE